MVRRQFDIEMSKYFFRKEVAKAYGVNEAILLELIHFRIGKSNHTRDGRKWWYGSIRHIASHFPFFTEKQVWRIMSSLEKQGALIVSNYNQKKYDRTKWYSVTGEALSHLVKPIPYVNNNNNNNKEFEIPTYKPL